MKLKFRDEKSEVPLEKVSLDDGSYITMPVKWSRHRKKSTDENRSEVFIEITDDEAVTSNNIQSSIFEHSDDTLLGISVSTDSETVNKIRDEQPTAKESVIHCTFQKKHHFLLRCVTTNVQITFIHHAKRLVVTEVCDKNIQLTSKFNYRDYIDIYSNKYTLMRKDYRLLKNMSKMWRSKSKEAVLRPFRYEPRRKEDIGNPISMTSKADTESRLYLNYHNITFVLHPQNVHLESIRPLNDDESFSVKHSEAMKNNRSRGNILVKYKKDIFLLKFEMENVNFEQVWLKTSTGTQCRDFHTYIKYYSTICNRMTHCPIPLSTYKYRDPLKRIQYNSRKRIFYGTQPFWKKDEKEKRLKNFCRLDIQKISRVTEINYTSTIQFKTSCNSLCKVKTGVQNATIIGGEHEYERMVIDLQRQDPILKKKEKEFIADSKHTSMEILDCDIISQDL